jgi:hypothetical protein
LNEKIENPVREDTDSTLASFIFIAVTEVATDFRFGSSNDDHVALYNERSTFGFCNEMFPNKTNLLSLLIKNAPSLLSTFKILLGGTDVERPKEVSDTTVIVTDVDENISFGPVANTSTT